MQVQYSRRLLGDEAKIEIDEGVSKAATAKIIHNATLSHYFCINCYRFICNRSFVFLIKGTRALRLEIHLRAFSKEPSMLANHMINAFLHL